MEGTEFEHIAARLRALVMNVSDRFFSALGMAEESEDVVQDVMLQLWRARTSLGEIRNIDGWAVRVTKNRCV